MPVRIDLARATRPSRSSIRSRWPLCPPINYLQKEAMDRQYVILVVNPGATSTKVSVYDDLRERVSRTIRHSADELKPYASVADQFGFRRDLVLEALREEGVEFASLSAVIGRGGLVKPIESGVYEVNDALRRDLGHAPQGEHALESGRVDRGRYRIAYSRSAGIHRRPVVVDELDDVARVAGHPLFRRVSIFHALNQKATGPALCTGKRPGIRGYESDRRAHGRRYIGRRSSPGAGRRREQCAGRRRRTLSGSFRIASRGQLADLCFGGRFSAEEVRRMICGRGGLSAWVGSNSVREIVERMKAGDDDCRRVIEAMAYQVAKQIGAMAAVLEGRVDAVLLTGGIAYSETVCDLIRRRTAFVAPVVVMPGEDEMGALAENALRVLRGEERPKIYE